MECVIRNLRSGDAMGEGMWRIATSFGDRGIGRAWPLPANRVALATGYHIFTYHFTNKIENLCLGSICVERGRPI